MNYKQWRQKMSVELAEKVKQLENQLKCMQSQAEVYNAEIQEKVAQRLSYRTNLHITQKAYQELLGEKNSLAAKVKELEDKVTALEAPKGEAA